MLAATRKRARNIGGRGDEGVDQKNKHIYDTNIRGVRRVYNPYIHHLTTDRPHTTQNEQSEKWRWLTKYFAQLCAIGAETYKPEAATYKSCPAADGRAQNGERNELR